MNQCDSIVHISELDFKWRFKMDLIEAIGNDLKISIDDLIHEIKNLKKEIKEIKSKLKIKQVSNKN